MSGVDWDILGVRDLLAHDNEYDCLVGRLLAKIVAGATTDQLSAHLGERIKHHFSLDPDEVDVARFVAGVNDW